MSPYADLNLKPRTLLGPGPSGVHPRVLQALAYPPVGHLDPQFLALMNEVQELMRFVFETQNSLTIPVSGTGSAGMEAAFANFVEPGDSVLIGVNGYFSERMVDIAGRYGAVVQRLDRPWGDVFTVEEIDAALRKQPAKLVALVHAETSTGALQPLEGMAEVVHRHGALLVVDCVTSLGGLPVRVDERENRHRLQRDAKVRRRSARPGAAHGRPGCTRGAGKPQDQGRQLVSGLDQCVSVLGSGAHVSPHCADQHELCSA